MKAIGIDFGDKNIGISKSDSFGWIASRLTTIKFIDLNNLSKKIVEIIKEYNIEKAIIGFPKNMNGTIGPRGEKTLEFVEVLKSYISKSIDYEVEIIFWDERLTTVSAYKHMNEIGIKRNKKKSMVDEVAAVYILQGYLDKIYNENKQKI